MIELYTAATPNGHKASIMLEEIGLDYNVNHIKLSELEQKEDWYLQLNPNGRIPVIVDKDNDDFAVFESGAILIYLAEKTGKLLPADTKRRSVVLQWLMFQMSGVGPMQGQANVFVHYAPEKIPYAIERYQKEVHRLYDVLNTRLGDEEYLAGEYSIADIATYPWVSAHAWCDVEIDEFTHLQRWLKTIAARPAVEKGMNIPESFEEKSEEEKEQGGKDILI